MATFTNQSKHTISPTNQNKLGSGWRYEEIDLDYEMPILFYNTFGNPINFINQSKHTATITNQIKN